METELDARITLVAVLPFDGRNDEALEIATNVIRRSRELHLDDEAGRAYRIAGAGESEVFEYGPAERMLRDGIAFAEQHELWNHRCYMTAHLGLVLWATGRWPEADDVASAALREGRGGVTTRITGLYARGHVALGRGRLEEARDLLQESLSLGEPSGDILRLSLPLWGLAETALLAGRLDDAIALTERGRDVSAAVDDAAFLAPFLVTGTRARLAGLGLREATSWVDDVGGVLRSSGIATLQSPVDHANGLIALARGETGQARTLLAAAVDGWDRIGRVWEGTWARLDLASCHLRSRRPQEAQELVADARSIADTLGSRPLADRAGELLRNARGRSGAADRWAPLTAREFDVARLIADGQTNARDRCRAVDRAEDGRLARRAHPGQAHGDEADGDRGLGQPVGGSRLGLRGLAELVALGRDSPEPEEHPDDIESARGTLRRPGRTAPVDGRQPAPPSPRPRAATRRPR